MLDWGDIKIPKYDKSKMWALTSKEQEEILGKNWPIEFIFQGKYILKDNTKDHTFFYNMILSTILSLNKN